MPLRPLYGNPNPLFVDPEKRVAVCKLLKGMTLTRR